MRSPRRSSSGAAGRARGFTLVELMVGIAIGLLTTLAITQVLVNAEGQKRTTTSGADAQVNGALALDTLQRAIQPAGYGFGALPQALGCALSASWNGAAIAGFPAALVPVTITAGANGLPDTVRVLASGKRSLSVPLRIEPPGYAVGGTSFPVASTVSFDGPQSSGGATTVPGELVAAVIDATVPCEVFQVTSVTAGSAVNRANNNWNAVGSPAQAYNADHFLVNLGPVPVDRTFSIQNGGLAQNVLQVATDGTPSYSGNVELFPGVVNLKALYGKDTDANGSVDRWDATTPTTNAEWRQLVAVRVAIVARSAQYEKDDVTFANPDWTLGTAVTVAGWWAACTAGNCPLRVNHLPDWQKYRYRVYDTIVPLRNMLWNA